MKKRFGRKQASWVICVLALTLLSQVSSGGAPIASEVPKVKLTGYLSPFGEENVALSCYPEAASGYYCDVVRTRNGMVVATAGIKEKEVSLLLERFFKELPSPVPSVSGETDPVMGWEIHYGDRESQGTVPRFERKLTGRVKTALLSLEAGLVIQFYQ